MRIEVRPVARLRADPAAVTAAVAQVLRTLGDGPADLSALRVVFDWIQYSSSFRDTVDLRLVLPGAELPGTAATALELAIDLRRAAGTDGAVLATGSIYLLSDLARAGATGETAR